MMIVIIRITIIEVMIRILIIDFIRYLILKYSCIFVHKFHKHIRSQIYISTVMHANILIRVNSQPTFTQ